MSGTEAVVPGGVAVEQSAAPASAPGLETTAAPAPENPSPEGATPETEKSAERTYTQAELDDILGKRLGRARRSWEREQAVQQAQPAVPTGELNRADFESDEAFDAARIQRAAFELSQRQQAEREHHQMLEAHAEREEKAREKYDDYDTVVSNEHLPISPAMATLIRQSEMGPELIYFLGQNPTEAERIFKLNPFLQAKEMGRLEARIAAEPPTRKTSSAPAPITPIRTPASKPQVVDTTDPRSTQSMPIGEWIAAENKRELAKLEARFH